MEVVWVAWLWWLMSLLVEVRPWEGKGRKRWGGKEKTCGLGGSGKMLLLVRHSKWAVMHVVSCSERCMEACFSPSMDSGPKHVSFSKTSV